MKKKKKNPCSSFPEGNYCRPEHSVGATESACEDNSDVMTKGLERTDDEKCRGFVVGLAMVEVVRTGAA